MFKKCNFCLEIKTHADFHKKKGTYDGLHTICKECRKVKAKQYYENNKDIISNKYKNYYESCKEDISNHKKKYYIRNKINILNKRKEYRNNNINLFIEKDKQYYIKNKNKVLKRGKEYRTKNKDKLCEQKKKYKLENKHIFKKWHQNKMESDPQYKIKKTLRDRIHIVLRTKGTPKHFKTKELLGCSYSFLIKYIENKFKEGMSWNNHGMYGWHLDHIKPCASFDLTDPEQQKQCFHYSNLQPLWAKDNLSKGAKWEG